MCLHCIECLMCVQLCFSTQKYHERGHLYIHKNVIWYSKKNNMCCCTLILYTQYNLKVCKMPYLYESLHSVLQNVFVMPLTKIYGFLSCTFGTEQRRVVKCIG